MKKTNLTHHQFVSKKADPPTRHNKGGLIMIHFPRFAFATKRLPAIVAALTVGFACFAFASGTTPAGATTTNNLGACINAGQAILPGQYLANGNYFLFMQDGGNFVAYSGFPSNSGTQALWASTTEGHIGAFAVLQSSDGNLVVYAGPYPSTSNVLWSANTSGYPTDSLCSTGDGNFVVYSGPNATGAALWATETNLPASRGATLPYNPGGYGQCTDGAEQEFHRYTGTYINTFPINGTSGNATDWAYNASQRGWSIGSTPRIDSIAVFKGGALIDGVTYPSAGHVAWVIGVYPSRNAVVIHEMNFTANGGGWNKWDYRTISPAFGVSGLQYIYVNP